MSFILFNKVTIHIHHRHHHHHQQQQPVPWHYKTYRPLSSIYFRFCPVPLVFNFDVKTPRKLLDFIIPSAAWPHLVSFSISFFFPNLPSVLSISCPLSSILIARSFAISWLSVPLLRCQLLSVLLLICNCFLIHYSPTQHFSISFPYAWSEFNVCGQCHDEKDTMKTLKTLRFQNNDGEPVNALLCFPQALNRSLYP